ncbi:MAG: TadE/TadG family type IV pilus assembly protein [Cypionkella sp.]
MKRLLNSLPPALRRFLRREDGTVIAEALIVLPVLLWAYVGLFVYWDCFRSINTVQKATYTVSDMLSREETGVQSSYITGLHKVLDYLIDSDHVSTMRVTSVTWSLANNRFEVHWSRSTNATSMPQLTTTTLQNYIGHIPDMTAGDYVVIVEVQVPYTPAFNIGLTTQTFSEFIVTRPRFLPCLPMDNISCPAS